MHFDIWGSRIMVYSKGTATPEILSRYGDELIKGVKRGTYTTKAAIGIAENLRTRAGQVEDTLGKAYFSNLLEVLLDVPVDAEASLMLTGAGEFLEGIRAGEERGDHPAGTAGYWQNTIGEVAALRARGS